MNLKAQSGIANVLSGVTLIITIGVFLFLVAPTIEDFRLQNLNDSNLDSNPNSPLMKILLYGFNGILWGLFALLSVFFLFKIVNTSRGGI